MVAHLHLFLCLCCVLSMANASAIPMWEFLTKEEKMSYLYSMFANQVKDFCQKTSLENCNKELLKYGLGKLKDMPEDHLDVMDPYQRGANDIIWGAMMSGHEMMKTSSPKPPTKPNSYEDESFGAFGAASAKIDNVYRVSPPKGFVYTAQSGTPIYTYPVRTNQIQATEAPLGVKVYPDGRPVNLVTQTPIDDDLRHYQLSKVKLPSI